MTTALYVWYRTIIGVSDPYDKYKGHVFLYKIQPTGNVDTKKVIDL